MFFRDRKPRPAEYGCRAEVLVAVKDVTNTAEIEVPVLESARAGGTIRGDTE